MIRARSSYFAPTIIPAPHVDDRRIHVSSAGANIGFHGEVVADGYRGDINHPFLTIDYARSFLRGGYGDRVLLRRGDTFVGSFFPLAIGGFGRTRPLLVMAYGTGPRPIVDTKASPFYQNSYQTTPSHIWFVGIHMTSSTYTGVLATQQKAIVCTWEMSDVLVEDCYIHNYGFGIDFEAHNPGGLHDPMHTDMRVRGCVIADIYVNSLATQSCAGFFAAGVTGLTVESNVFINCGWTPAGAAFASTFKHALYIHAGFISGEPASGCANVVVRSNICLNSDGFTIRCGGDIRDNFVWNAMSGIQVGMGDTAQDGGIQFNLDDNVVGGLRDYDGTHATIGYAVGNVGLSSTFRRNICARSARNPAVNDVRALWFRRPDFEADGVTPCNRIVAAPLLIEDNLFWHGGLVSVGGTAASYTDTTTWNRNNIHTDDGPNGSSDSFVFGSPGVVTTMRGSGNNFYQHGAHEAGQQWYYREGAARQDIDQLFADLGDAAGTHTPTAFADPERDTDSYAVSLGLPNTAALESKLRQRSLASWNVGLPKDALTANAMCAYIRAGFV